MPIELRCPHDERHRVHGLALFCMECRAQMVDVSCENGQLLVRALSSKSPGRVAFCFVDRATREQLVVADARQLHLDRSGALELKGGTQQSGRPYVLDRGELLLAYQAGSEVLEV